MPIDFYWEVQTGWKADENSRFGKVVVMKFFNTDNGEPVNINTWAPKLVDIPRVAVGFNAINIIDEWHKEYLNKLDDMCKKFDIRMSDSVKKDCVVKGGFVSASEMKKE